MTEASLQNRLMQITPEYLQDKYVKIHDAAETDPLLASRMTNDLAWEFLRAIFNGQRGGLQWLTGFIIELEKFRKG